MPDKRLIMLAQHAQLTTIDTDQVLTPSPGAEPAGNYIVEASLKGLKASAKGTSADPEFDTAARALTNLLAKLDELVTFTNDKLGGPKVKDPVRVARGRALAVQGQRARAAVPPPQASPIPTDQTAVTVSNTGRSDRLVPRELVSPPTGLKSETAPDGSTTYELDVEI